MTDNLLNALLECSLHEKRLFHAYNKLKPLFPVSTEQFSNLDAETIESTDQLVFRFMKLQDALGTRLFPYLLDHLEEQMEYSPMIDKLNRLEKLGFLQDTTRWQVLRNVRNSAAHEYPLDAEQSRQNLNALFGSVLELADIFHLVTKKLNWTYTK